LKIPTILWPASVRPTACSLARDVALSGHIDMRAQAEVLSARRTDTPRAIRLSALPASV